MTKLKKKKYSRNLMDNTFYKSPLKNSVCSPNFVKNIGNNNRMCSLY